MKKITFALTALVFTAGAAMAENPNMGVPADLYANDSITTIVNVQNPTKADSMSGAELITEESRAGGDR